LRRAILPVAVALRAVLRTSKIAPDDFVELGARTNSSIETSNKKGLLQGPVLDGSPGEIRTPDRSVRSPTGKMVSFYKSMTCALDQSQNVVIKNVNEPYLVMCWYIIATYE